MAQERPHPRPLVEVHHLQHPLSHHRMQQLIPLLEDIAVAVVWALHHHNMDPRTHPLQITMVA